MAKEGKEVFLKNGELLSEFTGTHWASGATAYDTGKGFWLERDVTTHVMGSPVGMLLALTHAASGSAVGDTRMFLGDSAGNKLLWDGESLTIVGAMSATSGDIGGWSIGSTALYKDGATAADSAGMSPSDYPFYAGAKYANRASATWRVTPAGKMYIEGTLYVSQAGGYSLVVGSSWGVEPTGNYGVFIGYQTGDAFADNYMTAIGYRSAYQATGDESIFLGPYSGANATRSEEHTSELQSQR